MKITDYGSAVTASYGHAADRLSRVTESRVDPVILLELARLPRGASHGTYDRPLSLSENFRVYADNIDGRAAAVSLEADLHGETIRVDRDASDVPGHHGLVTLFQGALDELAAKVEREAEIAGINPS